MAPAPSSAIGMAFAGKTASVDIPKPRDGIASAGHDSFAGVAANNPPQKQHGMLPTPPHSISPHLPPQVPRGEHSRLSPDSPASRPAHLDSDIDLQDDNAPAGKLGQAQHSSLNAEALDGLGDLDSAGAITPGMLAKHHLPDILLNHGPLAIRHVMGYLTTSVPGFSRISSAKARRLVVAALEGKGSSAEGGGRDGDVQFEKVGWGRWDARIKGQPPRDRPSSNVSPPASMPSSYSHGGFQTSKRSVTSGSDRLGTSMAGSSAFFSHSEMDDEYDDVDMLENEADKMSLDGRDDGYASSETQESLMDEDLGDGDVTDEEDWASIGAAALRARSLPSSGKLPSGGGRLYQPIADYSLYSRHRSRASGTLAAVAKPVPGKTISVRNASGFPLSAGVGVNESQERAAVEALLQLGSM